MKLSREMGAQLNSWAQNGLTVTSQEVTTSKLYLEMQHTSVLNVNHLGLRPDAIILLANIVASLPKVEILDISHTDIGASAPDFGKAIASSSIKTLIIYHAFIGAYAPAFGKAIASSSITRLNISDNNIGASAPDFGEAIASSSIKELNMSFNNMGVHAPNFLKMLIPSKNLTSLCIMANKIGKNIEACVPYINASKSLTKLDIDYNNLELQAIINYNHMLLTETMGKVLDLYTHAPKVIIEIMMEYLGNLQNDGTGAYAIDTTIELLGKDDRVVHVEGPLEAKRIEVAKAAPASESGTISSGESTSTSPLDQDLEIIITGDVLTEGL